MFRQSLASKELFRHTNSLTASLKQKLLAKRIIDNLKQDRFTGKAGAVTVVMDCYARVSEIAVPKERQGDYVDEHGVVTAAALEQDVKLAHWEAHRKILNAKKEAYRSSLAQVEGLDQHAGYSLWFVEDGASLPPYPHRALMEADQPEWIQTLRKASDMESVNPLLQPMLMGKNDEVVVNATQRRQYGAQERSFWERVELIRKAQTNALPGGKRPYKVEGAETTATEDSAIDAISLKFVRTEA